MQKLAHPNIITVYVFDRDDRSGQAFIAMELLHGKPLDHVIRAAPDGMSRKHALPVIRGMAEGLAYAHRNGLIHSDFKPANVFLTGEGVPKILDFGIAHAVQALESEAEGSAAMDDSGFRGYTPAYAAPEVMIGGAEPSTAEDVFALGLVAYELLTGRHPFNRMSGLEAQEAGLKPPPLRGLARREARAIQRAVAFDGRARQRDAAAFLRELQGVPLIQKVLVANVALLVLVAGGLWYRSYVDSLPTEPLERLPVPIQQAFREKIREGNESLAYLERTHDITASADAAEYFADAYKLHRKDPQAVVGLKAAADRAIAWYSRQSDKAQVREELKKFSARSEYYQSYGPLVRAIREAGGE
jgi:serine/threonine protein kinase